MKYTITRSFSKKINLGNFENADFYSCHTMELDVNDNPAIKEIVSEALYSQARAEVEDAIADYPEREVFDPNAKLQRMKELLLEGQSLTVEEYQDIIELIPSARTELNEAKLEYKREQYKLKNNKNVERNEK